MSSYGYISCFFILYLPLLSSQYYVVYLLQICTCVLGWCPWTLVRIKTYRSLSNIEYILIILIDFLKKVPLWNLPVNRRTVILTVRSCYVTLTRWNGLKSVFMFSFYIHCVLGAEQSLLCWPGILGKVKHYLVDWHVSRQS